jgi:hypothetical protein
MLQAAPSGNETHEQNLINMPTRLKTKRMNRNAYVVSAEDLLWWQNQHLYRELGLIS